MSEHQTKTLIILDGTNYLSWKTRTTMKLRNKKLLSCIENLKDIDPNKDSLALELLLDSIHPSLDYLIEDLSTTKEVWDKLKSHFDKDTLTSAMTLFSSVSNVTKNPNETINDLSHQIKTSYRKIHELKLTMDDFKILTLLNSLPPQYESIISTITDKSRSSWEFDEIVEKLVEAESRFIKWENSEVIDLAMKTKESSYCQFCRSYSHTNPKCYQNRENKNFHSNWNKNKRFNKNNQKASENFSLISQTALNTSMVNSDCTWYIDSGATQHFSPNKELFTDFETIDNYKVNIANGSTVDVVGKGKIILNIIHNNKPRTITITNVQYAPKMSFNLLSVSQLNENGAEIVFKTNKCLIYKNNQLIVEIEKQNNSYQINGTVDSITENIATYANKSVDLKQWHLRLGHSGIDQLKATITKNNSINKNILNFNSDWNCKTCYKGKLSVKPIVGNLVKANKPLEIIYSDVCGPIQVNSIDGFRYYVSFIDDFTRMSIVMLIKTKSDISTAFQEYVNLVQNQLKFKIKTLHSDNGTEYTSKSFQEILKYHGIIHSTTAPYTPQQNGVAERYNRTLVESATCLLSEHNIDIRFWSYAIKYANMIRNRLSTHKLNNKSPYSMWFNKNPDLSHFRTFGCLAINEIPKIYRKKFDFHSQDCIYLGAKNDYGNHYLFNPKTNNVFSSRNVEFIENETIDLNKINLQSITLISDYHNLDENSYTSDLENKTAEKNAGDIDDVIDNNHIDHLNFPDQSIPDTNISDLSEINSMDTKVTPQRIEKLRNFRKEYETLKIFIK